MGWLGSGILKIYKGSARQGIRLQVNMPHSSWMGNGHRAANQVPCSLHRNVYLTNHHKVFTAVQRPTGTSTVEPAECEV
jgi:hypothetical protein